MVDRSDMHGGVLIDKMHTLVQERDCLHADVRALLSQVARRNEEIAKLRLRVIAAASGNVMICDRCLDETQAHSLRAVVQEQRSEIMQLRRILAARSSEQPLANGTP